MKAAPKETPFSGSFGRKIIPLKSRKGSAARSSGRAVAETANYDLVEEEVFNRMLALERKRTERTGDTFVLMLIDCSGLLVDIGAENIERIGKAICSGARDTDLAGWYEYPTKLAVLFTALCNEDREAIRETLKEKTCDTLLELLEPEELKKLTITFHFYPEKVDGDSHTFRGDEILYPDLDKQDKSNSHYRAMKKIMDIVGSLCGLILFSPFFLVIPALIKLTSEGPVFFRQRRIGRFGKEFKFLKFRTMYLNNDSEVHRQYVKSLIEQREKASASGSGRAVFKIVNDPRVTPLGRFLRKTSLDEIPQFINVLLGEMSLVGPRPPIPYEVAEYRFWHRRRILEVEPGITGIWQVYGRSRTTFDEMVRLDLQYVREQSIWLDIKLLLKTPFAMIFGSGAY